MGPTPWAKIVAKGASEASSKGGADSVDRLAKDELALDVSNKHDNGSYGLTVDTPKPPIAHIECGESAAPAEKVSVPSENEQAPAAADSSCGEAPRETETKGADREPSATSSTPRKPVWNTPLISSNGDADPARPPLADIQQGAQASWPTLNDSKTQPKRTKSADAVPQTSSNSSLPAEKVGHRLHRHHSHGQSSSRPFFSQQHAGKQYRQGGMHGNVRHGSRNDRYNNREGGRGRRHGSGYHMNSNYSYYGYGPSREYVLEVVRAQIEYYFSVENLCKDLFLRSKMNANGYIELGLIASFNRVRMLSNDVSFIVEAIKSSTVVELSEDNLLVRAQIAPEQWVLPPEQLELAQQLRSPTARSEGSNMSEGSTPTYGNKENDADAMDDSSSSKRSSNSSVDMEDIVTARPHDHNKISMDHLGERCAAVLSGTAAGA